MALTPSTVTRTDDVGGKPILVFEDGSLNLIQAVALVDGAGTHVAPAGSWLFSDIDEAGAGITYILEAQADDTWRIQKIDDSGNPITFRWASILNNPSETTSASAWAARATTLTYNTVKDAF